jgi:hypothetical protein
VPVRVCALQWMVPVKWCAPEVLSALRREHVYHPAGDVYMYGVLLFEILSGGRRPWASHSTSAAAAAIVSGETLEAQLPERSIAADRMFGCVRNIAVRCWHLNPASRPTMDAIYDELHDTIAADAAPMPAVAAAAAAGARPETEVLRDDYEAPGAVAAAL